MCSNNGHPSGGGRGARLTPELLHKVLEWFEPTPKQFLQRGVHLYAEHNKYANGIFLSFLENYGFGRVRIGSGTKFDLTLAETMIDTDSDWKDRYALVVAGEAKWVIFKPSKSSVELTEMMGEKCLFEMIIKKKRMRIVVNKRQLRKGEVVPNDIKCQLKMEDMLFDKVDDGAESSEVQFTDHVDGDKELVSNVKYSMRKSVDRA
jgi:hypothetical protein